MVTENIELCNLSRTYERGFPNIKNCFTPKNMFINIFEKHIVTASLVLANIN